jgi:hypothetical protein
VGAGLAVPRRARAADAVLRLTTEQQARDERANGVRVRRLCGHKAKRSAGRGGGTGGRGRRERRRRREARTCGVCWFGWPFLVIRDPVPVLVICDPHPLRKPGFTTSTHDVAAVRPPAPLPPCLWRVSCDCPARSPTAFRLAQRSGREHVDHARLRQSPLERARASARNRRSPAHSAHSAHSPRAAFRIFALYLLPSTCSRFPTLASHRRPNRTDSPLPF